MALKFRHEALAEAHDFPVALALGIEVRAALAAADGQSREAVFQNLLKAQELQDGEVDRGVEAQTALVRANRGVELHPVAPVHMDFALIVRPRDTEADHALWLDKPFHQRGFLILRMPLHNRFQALQHFQHRLMEFLLIGVPLCHLFIDPLQIRVLQHCVFLRSRYYQCAACSGPCAVRFPPGHADWFSLL